MKWQYLSDEQIDDEKELLKTIISNRNISDLEQFFNSPDPTSI